MHFGCRFRTGSRSKFFGQYAARKFQAIQARIPPSA